MLGHPVVMHVAARRVCSPAHGDEVLARLAEAGIQDIFLIGGDCEKPLGPYASAAQLLPVLRHSRHCPRTIGVAAYPEGHPAITEDVLLGALRAKDGVADYMVTQLCYDPAVLLSWLRHTREAGIELPLFVGVPGIVDRRRLAEISLRVGVGGSLSFLRKQHGIRHLLGRHGHAAEMLCAAMTPLIGGGLGVVGLHFFTFNRLNETVRFADNLVIGRPDHATVSYPTHTRARSSVDEATGL